MTAKALTLPLAACALVLAAPMAAGAEPWLAPDEINFSGDSAWVTIDASTSDDLLDYGRALDPGQIKVFAPDGAEIEPENLQRGRSRTSFDLRLTQRGSTRVVMTTTGVGGTYVVDGKTYRITTMRRPAPASQPSAPPRDGPAPGEPGGRPLPGVSDPSQIPAGATDIKLAQSSTRSETFITLGAPTDWTPTGVGLELAPGGTPPTDAVADEPAVFHLIFDGEPAAGVEVEGAAANQRYLEEPVRLKLTTDAQGAVTVRWPRPGVYWLNARAENPGTIANAVRRDSYTAVVVVQKP